MLRGDNSKAEELLTDDKTYLSMAIRDVSMRCVPVKLVQSFDDTKTDVFRRLHNIEDEENEVFLPYYIKIPVIEIADDSEIEIDAELIQALIYFICSYLSNKKSQDFVKMAEITISLFDSYSVDLSAYDL